MKTKDKQPQTVKILGILAAAFLIYDNDLCQEEEKKKHGRKVYFLKDNVNISSVLDKE